MCEVYIIVVMSFIVLTQLFLGDTYCFPQSEVLILVNYPKINNDSD